MLTTIHITRDGEITQTLVGRTGEQSRFQPKQDHSSGEVGGSSCGSEGNKDIRDMLATQTQLLQQLVVKDKETQGKLLEHDTLLRNQQSAFLDLQRTSKRLYALAQPADDTLSRRSS